MSATHCWLPVLSSSLIYLLGFLSTCLWKGTFTFPTSVLDLCVSPLNSMNFLTQWFNSDIWYIYTLNLTQNLPPSSLIELTWTPVCFSNVKINFAKKLWSLHFRVYWGFLMSMDIGYTTTRFQPETIEVAASPRANLTKNFSHPHEEEITESFSLDESCHLVTS